MNAKVGAHKDREVRGPDYVGPCRPSEGLWLLLSVTWEPLESSEQGSYVI